jgi:hypothetical protein
MSSKVRWSQEFSWSGFCSSMMIFRLQRHYPWGGKRRGIEASGVSDSAQPFPTAEYFDA